MTSKTLPGFDPAIENRRIVWLFIFQAAGSKAEASISYNYRFHIFDFAGYAINTVGLEDIGCR